MVGAGAAVTMLPIHLLPRGLRESKAKLPFEQMIKTRPKRLET